MRAPQLAGYAATIAVVIGVDLPAAWLVLAAVLAGGFATFAVSYVLKLRS
jgi:hypothetical protein